MINYRAYKSTTLTSGQSGSYNLSGSISAWGVMRSSVASGSINLEGGGTIQIADITAGVPFPCYITSISVTAGSVYVLS
jgi:hypothetical protein